MITYYSSPRKTPDIYSTGTYAKIVSALKIKDEKHQDYFKETIERAALFLMDAKRKNKKRLTASEEKTELKRLAESLNKSRKILDSLCNKEQLGQFRIFSLIHLIEEDIPAVKNLEKFLGEYYFDHKAISLILQALEKISKNAQKKPYIFGKANKTFLILEWIWYFSDDWQEISKIKFAKGNDYNSPSMRILQIMIEPINTRLSAQDKITDSMLETAILMFNEYQKKHPEDPTTTGEFA